MIKQKPPYRDHLNETIFKVDLLAVIFGHDESGFFIQFRHCLSQSGCFPFSGSHIDQGFTNLDQHL